MKLRTVYKLHRWIAIFFGVALLNQLISGTVMILPRQGRTGATQNPPIDYHSITLSPSDAIDVLAGSSPEEGQETLIKSLDLRPILGRLFYEIELRGGATHLIDAESGEEIEIDSEIAGKIARSAGGATAPFRQIEILEHYDYRWRNGSLPVYRIAFDDRQKSVVYVDAATGSIGGRSDRWSRIRSLIGALHEFQPIGWLFGSNKAGKALLLLVALIGVATALSGYFLALPRRNTGTQQSS